MSTGTLKGGKSAGSPAKGGNGRAAGTRPKVTSGRKKATSKGSPPQTRRRSGKSKVVTPNVALAEESSKEAQPGLSLRIQFFVFAGLAEVFLSEAK